MLPDGPHLRMKGVRQPKTCKRASQLSASENFGWDASPNALELLPRDFLCDLRKGEPSPSPITQRSFEPRVLSSLTESQQLTTKDPRDAVTIED